MIPKVLIPLADGEILNQEVLSRLLASSRPFELVISTRPAKDSREHGINENRHALQQAVLPALDGNPIIVMDSDVLVEKHTLEVLLQHYAFDIDVVHAMHTKPAHTHNWEKHVITAIAVMSPEIFSKIEYLKSPDKCGCQAIAAVAPVEYVKWYFLSEVPKEPKA